MTHDEFVALLEKTNPRYQSLRNLVVLAPDHFYFARKGNDIVEVVERFLANNREPVIDKKLRVVIGCSAHRLIRAELYRYHKRITGLKDFPHASNEENDNHADAYTYEGMGYHFSSMGAWQALISGRKRPPPNVGEKYRPDRFDKDLFLFYEVETW